MQTLQRQAFKGTARVAPNAGRAAKLVVRASAEQSRRQMLMGVAAGAALMMRPNEALASPVPSQEGIKVLCDKECVDKLESLELVTLPSGLQYRDIVVGKGPTPPTGFQVVAHYVAMTPSGRVFESSLDKGKPYDIRVGGAQVIPGLDEGLQTMRPGGVRRLYIPGNLAFPKGLKAAAGRPSVPAASPVMFDVQLLYIPGLEDDE